MALLCSCSDRAVVRRFARVVVGLRDQAVLKQPLAALPVELGALEVGFSLRQVGLGSLVVGVGRSHPGYGGIQSSELGLNVGARLDVFETQQDVALPDLVALLHHDFGDLADAFTKDVGVVPGLNLARGGHLRSQILRLRLAGLHRHHALVGLLDAVEDDPAQNGCGSHANPHLFPRLHCLNSSTFSLCLAIARRNPARDPSLVYTAQRVEKFPGNSAWAFGGLAGSPRRELAVRGRTKLVPRTSWSTDFGSR